MDMAASGRSIFLIVAAGCYSCEELYCLTSPLLLSSLFVYSMYVSSPFFIGCDECISNCVSLINFYVFFWAIFYSLLFELHFFSRHDISFEFGAFRFFRKYNDCVNKI